LFVNIVKCILIYEYILKELLEILSIFRELRFNSRIIDSNGRIILMIILIRFVL